MDHPRIRGEHSARGVWGGAYRGIIPAYAGSTAASSSTPRRRRDHPRIRGEHEKARHAPSEASGSSPHTRGARAADAGELGLQRIIPAYAGSTPILRHPEGRCEDHPRIRGEHGHECLEGVFFAGSSPHTRGALQNLRQHGAREQDHPRIRGEHGDEDTHPILAPGSSPHTRGALPHARSLRKAGMDHPRIRGEHRVATPPHPTAPGSSPHTRGAHLAGVAESFHYRIIPAYAGSTGFPAGVDHALGDHPRIRGEHTSRKSSPFGAFGSSPHTRGAQPLFLAERRDDRIIPAYAGSTGSYRPARPCREDHPRIRGEHPVTLVTMGSNMGSSPHTRGALEHTHALAGRRGIIPAYAGSTGPLVDLHFRFPDHPRIRGEHIIGSIGMVIGWGSSPHTRGARGGGVVGGLCPWDHPRIRGEHSPDSTAPCREHGSSPHTRGALDEIVGERHPLQDHPRIRGEHISQKIPLISPRGSSPHTRGAHLTKNPPNQPSRIIPAYAGSTSREHEQITSAMGSSPHTRGARAHLQERGHPAGIIPAYAGSTSAARKTTRPGTDHPRIRGEHDLISTAYTWAMGSSPHTRGARRRRGSGSRTGRIIPAYAGSTKPSTPDARTGGDHPRIRGEHAASGPGVVRVGGSSPHTRGARLRLPDLYPGWRIIPAYAGSTKLEPTSLTASGDHPRIRGEHSGRFLGCLAFQGSSPHTRGAHHGV